MMTLSVKHLIFPGIQRAQMSQLSSYQLQKAFAHVLPCCLMSGQRSTLKRIEIDRARLRYDCALYCMRGYAHKAFV